MSITIRRRLIIAALAALALAGGAAAASQGTAHAGAMTHNSPPSMTHN